MDTLLALSRIKVETLVDKLENQLTKLLYQLIQNQGTLLPIIKRQTLRFQILESKMLISWLSIDRHYQVFKFKKQFEEETSKTN